MRLQCMALTWRSILRVVQFCSWAVAQFLEMLPFREVEELGEKMGKKQYRWSGDGDSRSVIATPGSLLFGAALKQGLSKQRKITIETGLTIIVERIVGVPTHRWLSGK